MTGVWPYMGQGNTNFGICHIGQEDTPIEKVREIVAICDSQSPPSQDSRSAARGAAFSCIKGWDHWFRLPELLAELAIARGEGVFKKVLNQYRKANLLILDEWMLVSLTETEARNLLEIIHTCHKRASTIFCSQFSPAGWHKKIGEATLADAILDRIVHDSYTIEIHGAKDDKSTK